MIIIQLTALASGIISMWLILQRPHVIAVERMLKNIPALSCEVFNLGTGNGFSVLEVIKAFEKVSGKKLNYKFVNRRPGDIEKVWADTSYANKVLGWKAIAICVS